MLEQREIAAKVKASQIMIICTREASGRPLELLYIRRLVMLHHMQLDHHLSSQ